MEEGKNGIKDKLDKLIELNAKLIEEKSVKKWKMPFSGKLNKKQLKKSFVTCFLVRNNRRVDIIKSQIDEGTTVIEGIPRLATADHVLWDAKGNPMIIIPEWTTTPFSPQDNYEKTVKDGLSAAGSKLLLNKMEKQVLDNTKKPGFAGGGIIIWIIVGVAVVGGIAYLAGYKFW